MEIKKVGVIGAGSMGSGIAQVCAQAGYQILLNDIEESLLDNGFETMRNSLGRLVKAGRIDAADIKDILDRISGSTKLAKLADVDFIIEAAIEDLEIKKNIFAQIDKLCGPHTIFTSNTSSLMISDISVSTNRPDKIAGMHWFNPPPIMKLIEVVKSDETSDETINSVMDLCVSLGKEPVLVKDGPGFFTTRYIVSWEAEAIRLFEQGIATIEDIDKMCKLAFNWRMGPIELTDFGGLDTTLHILEYLREKTGDEKFTPPEILKKLVADGYKGKKARSKGGFYEYFVNKQN